MTPNTQPGPILEVLSHYGWMLSLFLCGWIWRTALRQSEHGHRLSALEAQRGEDREWHREMRSELRADAAATRAEIASLRAHIDHRLSGRGESV